MRVTIRNGLVSLLALGLVPGVVARAQAPAAKTGTPPAPGGTASSPPAPPGAPQANLDQVLATVNGEKITRGDLLIFLSRYPVQAPGEQVYRDALDTLINTRLIGQFLNRQQIPAPPQKVNEAIAQLERELKAEGRDLQTSLRENRLTMDDLRREYADRARWVEFLDLKGTDAELKRFADTHKDLLGGTQVKASHIFLSVPPDAPPAEKEKVRQKLVALKKDIDAKKIGFAEAANKNSEDPANAEGSGGDIGYFGLNSGVIEEFAEAAFALKPGQVSDPVETYKGFHLILVTDRKEGAPVDFEQQKPLILRVYAADLQKKILTAERKNAQIEIKPMPPDLFPAAPPPSGTPAPASGTAPAPPDSPKEKEKTSAPK